MNILYEVGMGLGNVITTLPTIRALAELFDCKIDVYWQDHNSCLGLLEDFGFIKETHDSLDTVKHKRFDFYVRSALAPPRVLVLRTEQLVDLRFFFDVNREARFIPEYLFHFIPVKNFFSELGGDCVTRELVFKSVTHPRRKNHYDYGCGSSKKIGIAAGKAVENWRKRTWPHFRTLCEDLRALGYDVHSLGLPEEFVIGTKNKTTTSIRELEANLLELDLLVATDGGVAHTAELFGVPTIWLFGPTTSVKNGPAASNHQVIKSRADCSPCHYSKLWATCRKNICMHQISVHEVITAVDQFFHTSMPSPSETIPYSVSELDLYNKIYKTAQPKSAQDFIVGSDIYQTYEDLIEYFHFLKTDPSLKLNVFYFKQLEISSELINNLRGLMKALPLYFDQFGITCIFAFESVSRGTSIKAFSLEGCLVVEVSNSKQFIEKLAINHEVKATQLSSEALDKLASLISLVVVQEKHPNPFVYREIAEKKGMYKNFMGEDIYLSGCLENFSRHIFVLAASHPFQRFIIPDSCKFSFRQHNIFPQKSIEEVWSRGKLILVTCVSQDSKFMHLDYTAAMIYKVFPFRCPGLGGAFKEKDFKFLDELSNIIDHRFEYSFE